MNMKKTIITALLVILALGASAAVPDSLKIDLEDFCPERRTYIIDIAYLYH